MLQEVTLPAFSRSLARATVVLACLSVATVVSAEPTNAQRKLARQCEAALRISHSYIENGSFDKAAAMVKRVQQEFAKLEAAAEPDDRTMSRILVPLKRRLDETRAVLRLEGFELPEIKLPRPATPPSADRMPQTDDQPPPANTEMISFKNQVAPILVRHCVGCHGGSKPKGDLSMETFALLERGVGGSAIIDPGQSKISQLVEIIQSGEMPKGAGKVNGADLALIAKWIDQGAKFDGGNASLPLKQMGAAAPTTNPDLTPDAPAAGQVAFSTHIAPVIAQQCIKCHGGDRPSNRLNLTTFQGMMRGGMNGMAIEPGDAAGSLLIQKIKGTAAEGNRMPLNNPPLSAGVISEFETWVASGARFDGPDPSAPVTEVAALAVAKNATHEELSQQRESLAEKNWRLALHDVAANTLPTENFLIYGSADPEQLKQIAELAEKQQAQIREWLSLPDDGPLVKGRATIYVFGSRVDYSEFVYMIENRKADRNARGHARYTIVDAYGCVVPPSGEDYEIAPLLAQQIAANVVAARSDAPTWFSEGVGRSIAAKIGSEDPRVINWDEQIGTLAKQLDKPDDFIAGRLPPESAAVLSYGFVSDLMRKPRQFNTLLKSMWQGQPLDAAFQAAYKQSPSDLAAAWVRWSSKRSRS